MKQQVKIYKIKGNTNNPRIIKNDKFKKLVKSIQEFPEMLKLRPIVVDEDMIVLGGNMRLKASKDAGLKEVWIEVAEGLTEEQKKEFIVKDNVGFGEWEWDMLANEWDSVQLAEWGLDVWQNEDDVKEGLIEDDEIPEVKESIVKRGDIWLLGNHRLMCGDSTNVDDVKKLMNGDKADMVFTDPPYDLKNNDYTELLFEYSIGSVLIMNGDSHSIDIANKHKQDFKWFYIITRNTPFISFSREVPYIHHTLISHFRSPKRNMRCFKTVNEEISKYDVNNNEKNRYAKNVSTIEPFILNLSNRGEKIMDLFCGTGTSLIICEKNNRQGYMMEIDEIFCDTIINRWEQFTGKKAIKNGTE